jgi:ATP-binding cassette subfamily B protein
MAIMPFLVISVYRFRTQVRPLSMAVQDQMGKVTAAIQQNLIGIRVVKAFAREKYEVDKFSGQAHELLDRNLQVATVSAKYQPLLDFLTYTGMVLILWYGGMQVIHHQLTIGALVAFYTYLGLMTGPVRILGWVVNIAQYAVVSAERVFEILDTHPEAQLRDGSIDLKSCGGEVEFRDISFSYADGCRALDSINLKVEPGLMVALVGATGSGKSTVINLLPRFYDVTEGALLIDGTDIRKYRLASLRRNIGIVSQETFLFGDTVRENIAYGRPESPFERVVEAAKAANIHDFIMTLPDGYETRVGERGVNLSGGQKQRVAIARALLMNPPILILDDSTSSVDMETEALIQKALVSLTESRTTFVVAQRVSTIKRADIIIVLDKGRIVESGTHEELLAKGERYAEIYQMQFGDQQIASPETVSADPAE